MVGPLGSIEETAELYVLVHDISCSFLAAPKSLSLPICLSGEVKEYCLFPTGEIFDLSLSCNPA